MPLIDLAWQPRLHAFLGGSLRQAEAVVEAIGGTADHVHLLIGIRATHRLADLVRDLKRSSSQWVHENTKVLEFAWQEGSGAFSVGASRPGGGARLHRQPGRASPQARVPG